MDEGIEKALRVSIAILDDPRASPATKTAAAKFFYMPMMRRLGADTPDVAVTPQERFLTLMREVRDVPARQIIVTEDDITDIPTDELPTFEHVEPRASAS